MPAPVLLPDAMPLPVPSRQEERVERQPDIALPPPVFETVAETAARPHSQPALLTGDQAPPDPRQVVAAVASALAAAGLSSASDAMADAVWSFADREARVQTELSKTMLPVVMNPEAEKIVRGALREGGIAKLKLLPGVVPPVAAKKVRPARAGTVQARALEHPMVQQAQKLFNAEIQTVIDLREDD
jgi:DNA polymerase-3 subunit gamma/tau